MNVENEERLLAVLASGTNIERLLTPQEALTIQSKLWDTLAKRAESYTMGGSSSVRVETAQELLKSAGFVISHGFRNGTGGSEAAPEELKARLLMDDYDALFKTGLKVIEKLVEEGETLLDAAIKTATAVENRAYHNTLKELGIFFKRYHYHHFAHDIPCMLDYPLAHPVDEALLGIDYINDYLRRLLIENEFCSRFDAETVTALLKSAAPDFKEDLLNIYETAAANALALTLLGGDIITLDVTHQDRGRLAALIGDWTVEAAPVKLRAIASGLCVILDIGSPAAAAYLALTASELYVRVKPILKCKRLERVFPSLYREKPAQKCAVTYIDGALMDDEKLRALIDTLTSCRHVSDKIALARRYITSLRDWAEILGICFWGDELNALFTAFSNEERDLLLRYVRKKRQKYPDWISESGWENALIDFLGS